ncbi:hypothetical protein EXIGLDRAFT_752159 [Exidia glandulosa HHB12029]|uniref:Uncharacterized protein n=1 Tax=Exidia glandulosa HHB12029 TaxID=1314781 RepID=A0A165ESM4_EXIGL|nr:hypothetical protein EXIGLDRAFT_752159 [Exidia glandulosa HHB12029]
MQAHPFPPTLPREQPPPKYGTVVNGLRQPEYALAWRCDYRKLRALTAKIESKSVMNDLNTFFGLRWVKIWTPDRSISVPVGPQIFFGEDGYYYLPAMHNTRFYVNYDKRACDPNDALFNAAKETLLIDDELEPTLMWYRYPYGARWRGDPKSESDDEDTL